MDKLSRKMHYYKWLLAYIFLLLIQDVSAQKKDSALSYPIVVKFQSTCCGVPNGEPLRKMVLTFKKKNKLKSIISYQIGPLGREGEYIVAFPLAEMNSKQQQLFIKKLYKVVPILKDKGYATIENPFSVMSHDLPSNVMITPIEF